MMKENRYDGRPFLRLLECYVMWCAGELDSTSRKQLVSMTPQLQKTYKTTGSWQKIVAEQMQFSKDLQSHILELWKQNVSSGEKDILSVEDFARRIVDENFSDLA